MMKKLVAFGLAALLLLSLSACGDNEEDIRGDITPNTTTTTTDTTEDTDAKTSDTTSTSAISTDAVTTTTVTTTTAASTTAAPKSTTTTEKEFSLGQTSGGKYENSFIGLGCALSGEWTFYNDDQIKQLNDIVSDSLGEDLREQLEKANVVYDMFAQHSGGLNCINVVMEKVGLAKAMAAEANMKEYVSNSLPAAEKALEDIGYKDVTAKITTVKIDKKTFTAAKISANIGDVTVYETQVYKRVGQYVIAVTVATYNEDTTEDILDCFYIVQ